MSGGVPQLLVAGDPRHGVVRLAGQLAAAVRAGSPEAVVTDRPRGSGPLHVHFTDRLWGPDPGTAARRLRRLADGRRLTVTLHDVPQASDGAGLSRRLGAYREVIAAADGIVVCSEHERSLLVEHALVDDAGAAGIEVIPLPVIPLPVGPVAAGAGPGPDAGATPPRAEVALLGWVYPGKGHAEAIDAVARLETPRPRVCALGAPAPGHEPELARLHARARRRGVGFTCTGWLDEAALADRARRAFVPLAAHAHVSASGSINSWIAAGRVPLVADSRYARELERLRPGTIRRYAPARLSEAIRGACADEALTRRGREVDTRPHLIDVAERYRRWWAAR